MTPTTAFSKVPDQLRIRLLKLERSAMPQPGRVMFWRGRHIIGHGDVAKLGETRAIPKDADTISASDADYDDLKAWGFS